MGKRAEIRARRDRERRRQKMIGIGIVAAGVILIVAVILMTVIGQNNRSKAVAGGIIMPAQHDRPMVNGMSMGSPDAPVRVYEFSNFECSHCKTFAEQAEDYFAATYIETGDVYLTFVPFTWTDSAARAAEAAYCAMDQDKFWEYHDIVFANQGNSALPGFTDDVLIAMADKIGLDNKAFESCLTGNQYTAKVAEDSSFAQEKGATGTPTFEVNGTLVYSDKLEQTIQEALEQ